MLFIGENPKIRVSVRVKFSEGVEIGVMELARACNSKVSSVKRCPGARLTEGWDPKSSNKTAIGRGRENFLFDLIPHPITCTLKETPPEILLCGGGGNVVGLER